MIFIMGDSMVLKDTPVMFWEFASILPHIHYKPDSYIHDGLLNIIIFNYLSQLQWYIINKAFSDEAKQRYKYTLNYK